MKTYLMRIPEILKGISETLDITATLCDKSWVVFNDEGVKILFIFERDGTLIVSRNGVVSKQRWSYIQATKAILIDNAQQSFLLHPAFIDNVVFALNQDGTQHHLFMIDEGQIDKFPQFTLDILNKYFISKVQQIEEEKERERKEVEKRLIRVRVNRIAEKELKPLMTRYKIWYYMPLVVILVVVIASMILFGIGIIEEWVIVPTFIVGLIIFIVTIPLIENRVDELKHEIDKKRDVLWQKYLNDKN